MNMTQAPQREGASTSPCFTVILTTYNRADLLPRAIRSVLAQSVTDYELIIVDDASPDNSEEVAKPFIAPNIRYLRQPTNLGVSAARNAGIDLARGEFVVFLDDDDCLAPDYLYHVQQALSNAPATVGFALPAQHISELAPNGKIETKIRNYGTTTATIRPRQLNLQRPTGGSGGLIARLETVRAIGGFSTEHPLIEDIDFILRMAAICDLMIIPQAILHVNHLPLPRLTTDWVYRAGGRERLADRHRDTSFRAFPMTSASYYIGAARLFYSQQKRADGRRCLWKALRITPLSYQAWKFLLLLEASDLLPLPIRSRAFFGLRR